MARLLTPMRIARVSRQSFQSIAETVQVDFELGVRQGVLLHAVEFGMGQAIHVPGTTFDNAQAFLSLHAETGALEAAADALQDTLVLNSEIIAEAVFQSMAQDEAATRGGSASSGVWLSPNQWHFRQLLGDPLLLATNLTFRGVTSVNELTVNGAFAHIYYQYVELTSQELANQFILRR